MPDVAEMILTDLKAKYDALFSSPEIARLYEDDEFGHMFSVLHGELNRHFEGINGRAESTHHYWADDSREMLYLIADLDKDLHKLKRAGVEVELHEGYRGAIARCRPWLSRSGGSTVPDNFELIEIIEYEPVFHASTPVVRLKKQQSPIETKLIGEGSYAHVHSYVDPDYGIRFAIKRAKRGITARDLERFKQEFEVLNRLSFPYVVEVYHYNEERNEYRMEFCDETLESYISSRNARLPFSVRKRIALQFLYGINYIHWEGLLHRDISLQNVLLKVYSGGAVLVKLSDFGLVKEQGSTFTRTGTEIRGTIRDPLLESFRDYSVLNEMYSIGFVLSYIFTGRKSLKTGDDEVSHIVQKCTAHRVVDRYQAVLDLISDVERLESTPTDTSA